MLKHFIYSISIVLLLLGCGSDSGEVKTASISAPTLSFTPESTYKDSYSIEVHGKEGLIVYVNGVAVATIKGNDKVSVDLDTSGPDGSTINFEITLKNTKGLESDKLIFSIEKGKQVVTRETAIKLLRQTSFTSRETEIDEIMLNGEIAWIDKQLNIKSAHADLDDDNYGYLEALIRRKFDVTSEDGRKILEDPELNFPLSGSSIWNLDSFHNRTFLRKMFEDEDQLRQRMALALSEIIVISTSATSGAALSYKSESLIKLYDELYRHSFGNYRDILKETSMSSAMAYYLTYIGNKKESTTSAPDENYARELMQLFSIGVYKLNLDGTAQLGNDGYPIPSYTQEDVSQLARVFTGWDWHFVSGWGGFYGNLQWNSFTLVRDIEFNEEWHDTGSKTVLGETISAGLDGEAEIDRAIDILMANPNMAPHVSKHLIMRLVTSNPSPAYVARVATVFNNNGNGVKGDLKATVEAILKDNEARGINQPANFGKVDTLLLAFSHFASRLNVKALSDDDYAYKWSLTISGLPLTAGSVFNFYTNEDAPNDQQFIDNNLVAPEVTTRADASLKNFMKVSSLSYLDGMFDVHGLIELNGGPIRTHEWTTWEEWMSDYNPTNGLQYDLKDIYDYFMPGHNGSFRNLNGNDIYMWRHDFDFTDDEIRTRLEGLADFIAIKFLGKVLPTEYRDKIVQQSTNEVNPANVVKPMLRKIVNTSQFMILD